MEQETKTCPYCGEEILAVAKKCKYCGEWINNDEEQKEEIESVPCPICGELIDEGTTQCPHCNESIVGKVIQEPVNEKASELKPENQTRSFFSYYFVEPFLYHYFKFKGRINRKHFWISMLLWYAISALLITIAIFLLDNSVSKVENNILMIIFAWFVGSIIPIWAIFCRRMRDGDSELSVWAWWAYIFGTPFLLWWLVKPSDNIMRDDGLAPDETPKVAFKKSDIITIITILLLSFGVLGLSYYEGNNEAKDTKIENTGNKKPKELFDIKIRNPYVEDQSDNTTTIEGIISNRNCTIISFRCKPEEDDTWITISENTYIEVEGQKLKLIEADGIPISPEKKSGLIAGNAYYFYLYFPPIPNGTKVIDIYEDEGWHWMGVHLKKKFN